MSYAVHMIHRSVYLFLRRTANEQPRLAVRLSSESPAFSFNIYIVASLLLSMMIYINHCMVAITVWRLQF